MMKRLALCMLIGASLMGCVAEPVQLQRQALGGRARADAGRIKALQHAQRGLQFVEFDFEFGRQICKDFIERA